jgi:hypothetical protein
MKPKLTGCCSRCDVEVFDVVTRDPETRHPKRLGRAHEDAMRVSFLLVNGSRMDLTFCAACANELQPADYPALWTRVMVSWVAEGQQDNEWAKSQVNNGIVGLLHQQPWREVT